MSGIIEWRIPLSTLKWLERIPANRPVTLLLRHSVRGSLPTDGSGYEVPITKIGACLARELGQLLGTRLRSLHTSPLLRCVQTAEAMLDGSATRVSIVADSLLGDPGVFVLDGEQARLNWEKLGHEEMMRFLVNTNTALPGMANPAAAARFLVQHMLSVAGDFPGLHVFVTHDSLVAATALRLLGQVIEHYQCPQYLEGVFFWREKGHLNFAGYGLNLAGRDQTLALKIPLSLTPPTQTQSRF